MNKDNLYIGEFEDRPICWLLGLGLSEINCNILMITVSVLMQKKSWTQEEAARASKANESPW